MRCYPYKLLGLKRVRPMDAKSRDLKVEGARRLACFRFDGLHVDANGLKKEAVTM